MSEFKPGLEGVVAFETEIAEPDRDGGSLRYRGVDIEELVGSVPVRAGLGPARRRELRARPAGRRPVRGRRPDRQHAGRPAVGDGAPRRRMGPEEADRHHRRRGARGSPPHLGAVHLDRGAVGADRGRRRPIGSTRPSIAQGNVDRRALPARVARRGRSQARPGDRHLLDLHLRARPQRLDLRRADHRVDGLGLRRGALVGRRRALRPAARRRARPGAADARRGRRVGRPRALRREPDREGRAADGLRPPRLPRRGSARPPAQGHGEGARRAALRRRRTSSSRRRSPRCGRSRPTGRSRRTSSSGRRSCSTSPTCRRSSRPRCSPARARRAGRRTSSSRRSSTGSSGRPRSTSARAPARPRRSDDAPGSGAAGRRACRRRRPEGARDAAAAVGRGARARRAERRLPHPRPGLPRDRAVPLPAEARARPARAAGREPGRARLGADRARRALPRPPGRREQRCGRCCTSSRRTTRTWPSAGLRSSA